MNLVRTATFGLTLAAAGCDLLEGRCVYELRSVEVSATLTNAALPDSGSARLNLFERRSGRGHPSQQQQVTYVATSSLDRATVTAVHLHAGPVNAAGRVLYDIPIKPGFRADDITVSAAQASYEGPADFRYLFALVRDSVTHFDVHVGDNVTPLLAGPSFRSAPVTDWTRPYCS